MVTNQMEVYNGFYIYKNSKIPISISNDGDKLSFLLFGCRFQGDEFSDFKSSEKLQGEILNYMEVWECPILDENITELYLCNCIFELDIPQTLIKLEDNRKTTKLLQVTYSLGKARPNGGLNSESVELSLDLENINYTAKGGFFETAFDNLCQKIGNNYYFKNCYGCLFSDYSIYGQTSFGGMQCFFEDKTNYLKAENKFDFAELKIFKLVQETFVCDKFQKREVGTGYRG